jgi:hypothetical protein
MCRVVSLGVSDPTLAKPLLIVIALSLSKDHVESASLQLESFVRIFTGVLQEAVNSPEKFLLSK